MGGQNATQVYGEYGDCKGVTLYQYDGTAWVKLAATALPNHRAKVEGVDPTKMFAAVAETSGLIVSLR